MRRQILRVSMLAVLVASLVFVAGCSRPKQGANQTFITIKGSDTMVHLASTWAEAFMKANPGLEVSVTGGGSGTGIAALLNGTTDICAASRSMKPAERDLAGKQNIAPKEYIVGRDGIAVVVNPDNPVKVLTLEQLKKIFTGASTSWSAVGGNNSDFLVLSRESNSGTYVFFQEHVLQKQDYTPQARLMPATSAIIQATTADVNSIGYVGLGFAADAGDKIHIVDVKADASSEPVTPSLETVRDGSYPIARPLFFYTNGEPTGNVKKFIDFCMGPEGQKIVVDIGYIPF